MPFFPEYFFYSIRNLTIWNPGITNWYLGKCIFSLCVCSSYWGTTSQITLELPNVPTLGPCFPPAAGRGPRLQPRGAVNARPAPLLCEHGEDRNQRSPLRREPNAETSDSGGTALSPQCCFYSTYSELAVSWHFETVGASLTVSIERLWILLFTLLWWLSVNQGICKEPLRIPSAAPRPYGSDHTHHSALYPVIPSEPELFRPIRGLMCSQAKLWDKEAESEITVSQQRGHISASDFCYLSTHS